MATEARLRIVPILILATGALVYAGLEGPGAVTFFITPLFVGLTAVVAGLIGSDRHLVPAGLPIAGWGVAALLGNEQVFSADRIPAAYMVGLAAGILVARLAAPPAMRAAWVTSATISALVGSLGYLVEFNVHWLGRWPAWCASLVLWTVWEVAALKRRRPGTGTPSEAERARST